MRAYKMTEELERFEVLRKRAPVLAAGRNHTVGRNPSKRKLL